MKKFLEHILYFLSILLRFFPFSHNVGLFRFGKPDANSPVLVSGNWLYIVEKLKKKLKDKDCYLLVADSAGINIWCASGVGDFNEHKIADAVNSTGLKDVVNHQTLILPQLCAVGVDRDILEKECSFKAKWGPANLEDLDEFFNNNLTVTDKMRFVKWPLKENIYIAIGKLVAYYLLFAFYFIYVIFFGSQYNNYAIFIAVMILINLSATVIELKRPFKWPATYVVATGIILLIVIALYAFWVHPLMKQELFVYLALSAITTFIISADMIGNEHLKTTVGHWLKTFNAMSLFQPKINEKCICCGECIHVCPKGLFLKKKNVIEVDLERYCCECLACVKQCSAQAINNINKGSYKKDIKVIPNIDEIMN